jgi:hypothetical protein
VVVPGRGEGGAPHRSGAVKESRPRRGSQSPHER